MKNVVVKKEILQKARRLLREKNKIKLCIEAGICPVCGARLKECPGPSHYGPYCTKCDWSQVYYAG